MPLLNKTLVLGAHAYYVRNGTADGGDTVGSAFKPLVGSALWEELGYVMDGTITGKDDPLEIMAPRSGGYGCAKRETLVLAQELAVKLTMGQICQYTIEALLHFAGAITINTAQRPLVQDGRITGWLKLDTGDQNDTQRLLNYFYCELSVNELKIAQKDHKHTLNVEVLDNALNSTNLVSLS